MRDVAADWDAHQGHARWRRRGSSKGQMWHRPFSPCKNRGVMYHPEGSRLMTSRQLERVKPNL